MTLKELTDFLKEQRFLGIGWSFYSDKCLEIFADDREKLNDVKPLLKSFDVTEKHKSFMDRSENIIIAVMIK